MKNDIEQTDQGPRLIYFPELRKLTGLSRSTIWKLEKAGRFPRRRLVTDRRVGWIFEEVASWISSRSIVKDSEAPSKCNLPSKRQLVSAEHVAPCAAYQTISRIRQAGTELVRQGRLTTIFLDASMSLLAHLVIAVCCDNLALPLSGGK